MAKTGKAIIFITHNVEESLILADRIILMTARPGQIKRQFVVNHSRPRDLTNPKLIMLQRKIKFFCKKRLKKSQRSSRPMNARIRRFLFYLLLIIIWELVYKAGIWSPIIVSVTLYRR